MTDDPFIKMRSIRVTYEDGNTIDTNINGTRKEITDYYVGKYFNFGIEDDHMVKAVAVEFLDTATTDGASA